MPVNPYHGRPQVVTEWQAGVAKPRVAGALDWDRRGGARQEADCMEPWGRRVPAATSSRTLSPPFCFQRFFRAAWSSYCLLQSPPAEVAERENLASADTRWSNINTERTASSLLSPLPPPPSSSPPAVIKSARPLC